MEKAAQPAEFLTHLPPHLGERCRLLGGSGLHPEGEFVLYWMHHAVRAHENPALDVALDIGNRLQLPVLVYQGLGGDHRYNNDRHHSFILQGARDAHRVLRARGIRAVFHLASDRQQRSPLNALAPRAAAVIVEDFPVPPFPAWSRRLASHVDGLTIAVDCSCIVPMRLQSGPFSRAYAFRQTNREELTLRVPIPWQDAQPSCRAFTGDPGFEALDLEQADIAALCAACDIDHGVPPVAHTVGGSEAGYARWDAFRSAGLSGYARLRNDAAIDWPRGVSRLSPYLHHGHVSPFRIAREAMQHGGDGAQKFLDELLIWRELAFNFCFHTADPDSLACLPEWARQTLLEHATDTRAQRLDEDTLARSLTGEPLWDLAQTSLRIHGELHNNLRMTWAKAIPYWRPDPAAALHTLIELNHRYALDGSDPNSYGGLLWALGLFDRPFDETPVLGRVRNRSVQAHTRRLDLAHYAARVSRPSSGKVLDIAVIGAGVAGLSAARSLHDQGHRVTVFEKSRGLGGRAATRRIGDIGLDHGAQYFSAEDPAFRRVVDAWIERGQVAPWRARIGRITAQGISASHDEHERFVAVPGMSALGRLLGEGQQIQRQTRVAPPVFSSGRWQLRDERDSPLGGFDALVIAAPAPQAAELMRPSSPELARQAEGIRYLPAWSAMLRQRSADELGFDGLFFDTPELAWAARNGSKPGRQGNTWVLHASTSWSQAHLETDRALAGQKLMQAFCDRSGIDPNGVELLGSHRWLYSLVEQPLAVGALWDAERSLAVCGDWCQGARIQGAYLSGQAAAGHLLRALSQEVTRESDASAPSLALELPMT